MNNKNNNDTITGKVTLTLDYVQAVKENGSPDHEHCPACEADLSRFKGMRVTTQYSINTKTLIMSAVSSFPSPNKLEPLEIIVKLNALGISGRYAFGSFRPPNFPEAYAVLFSIDTKLEEATSSFLLFGPEGKGYNCLISSSKNALNNVEGLSFKVE